MTLESSTVATPDTHDGHDGQDAQLTRRKVARLPVALAVELSSKAKPGRCGVTRNASGRGLLIVTPSRFSVGDELDLAVHVGAQSGRIGARVVRVEENGRDSTEVWRYRLAVELAGELPNALIEEARARDPVSAVHAKAG